MGKKKPGKSGDEGGGDGNQQQRNPNPQRKQVQGQGDGAAGTSGTGQSGRRQPQQQPQQRRPGNWECSKCGVDNFSRNTKCYKCDAPKVVAGPSQQKQQQHQGGQQQQHQRGGQRQQEFPTLPAPTETRQPTQNVWGQPPQSIWKQPQQDVALRRPASTPESGSFKQQSKPPAGNYRQPERPATYPERQSHEKQQPMSQGPRAAVPGTSRELMPSNSSVSEKFQDLSLSKTKSVQYPVLVHADGSNFEGTKGMKHKLQVNFLPITLTANLPDTAYHYDVTFDPDRPKKFYQAALEKFFMGKTAFAFDGKKNIYTARPLEDEFIEKTVEVLDPSRDGMKMFKVTVKFATEVDMRALKLYNKEGFQELEKPSQALQVLDVVLRTIFKKDAGATVAGRAIYYKPDIPRNIGDGMELWLGLFQSAILGRKQIYLNVDVAHKAFAQGVHLLDVLQEFKDRRGNINWNSFEQHLKQLDIEYHYPEMRPKVYRFNGLKGSAAEEVFALENGPKMTVKQYFEREKRYPLKHPNLPLLHVGSTIRNIYLPIELCYIAGGQANNKKCTPNCVREIIQYSATSTEERKQKIFELLQKVDYSKSEAIMDFGVQINKNEFERVEARTLNPPDIQYSNNKIAKVNKGVWNGEKFLQTGNQGVIKWAILNCDNYIKNNDIEKLRQEFKQKSKKHQILLDENPKILPFEFMRNQRRGVEMLSEIMGQLKKDGFTFVVVVIIDGYDCYPKVKQAAELNVGILTQCIKSNTVQKRLSGATVDNIILKVNAKLNGINHKLLEASYNAVQSDTMFMGGDVTHPSPEQRDIPSVVGVTASHDPTGFKYSASWRLQNPREEMIREFKDITVNHMNFYKQRNGRYPNKIMYFRDGVSEGQFEQVLAIELKAMKEACTLLRHNVKITFVIVQKRHHIRFFPESGKFADGRNKNIIPGTVVDKDIVHPHQYQFYLASHAAIQGVTKPAKYCIIHDENNIKPDDMQAITNSLCFLFTRCNRAVSYPAPTYYAHLVAARGKNYILGGNKVKLDKLDWEYNRRTISDDIINGYPMFFV